MVSSTRSRQSAKDKKNSNRRLTRSSKKAKIKSRLNVLGTAGIRKSPRETPLKKIIASSSSTQKSKQVEKRILSAPEARRKSERVEKKKIPSPLIRSGRTKNLSSSSPSNSKSAGSLGSISRQKLQKEKSMKQLIFETEVNENGEHDVGTSQVKSKRMDARTYRALFRNQKKDCLEKSHRISQSNQEGDNSSGDKTDELSKQSCSDNKDVSNNATLPPEDAKAKETGVDSMLSRPITNLAENSVTSGSFIPSNTPTHETSEVSRSAQPDCCREQTFPTLVSGNSKLDDKDLVSNNVGLDGGEKLTPSKRKVISVDMDSNVSSPLSKEDNCNMIPDALPSNLDGNKSCSKQIRLDYNPTVKESCDPCAAEHQDGDDIEATMLQKDKSDHTSGIGHQKDSFGEDKNILDGQSDTEKDGLIYNSNKSVVQPKEKLSSHIANRCKSDSFRFVEYWIPAQISHVQLEQYCATLLSNASILCSSPKIDSVGAIRDVLISTRKCCNHPYVNDPSMQPLLFKGLEEVEYLNVGIKASGKLQLLDSMLKELKKNDLRALLLFQSIGGSGKDSIGDILDDFLRQRFGLDSYERIDKGVSPSKKQAAMKKFNDKNNKRFVFLMETCACLPSIKLSSIDTIIIYDSDWNPMNDIRSLQKITLDSQFELIKMFRLYSAFTVEEKALILARQAKILDINTLFTNRSLSHTLLMWGASCLFDELGIFHNSATSTSSPEQLLEETVSQFSSFISDAVEDSDKRNHSILLKVHQNGGTYCASSPLFGELKIGSLDEESPQNFWTKLLEGKQFQWKYSCSSSQRSRKRVQPFNNLEGESDFVYEGIAKKRTKVSNNIVDQPSLKSEGEKLSTEIKADKPKGNDVEFEKNGSVHDEQRSLHLSLKPQITKLCEILLLPDNVKKLVDCFLEYVMNNHHVSREPVSMLQAFQISLIWTAAAMQKHKLDHKASLILAKQHLNFDCKKGEANYSYSLLRCLKKIFRHRTGTCSDTSSPQASNMIEVELFKKDLSKSIKETKKKCEKMLNNIRLMQKEEKHRLRTAIEVELAELERKQKIELAFTRSCSPNEVTRTETLKILNIDHQKSIEELKFQHELRLKDLEDKQSAHMLKAQDWVPTWVENLKSWAKNELQSIVSSKELGTGVDYSLMIDNVIESMKDTGDMVPETNSSSVSKTVEKQNSLGKHDNANEVGIMVSNRLPVSGSEDHNAMENHYVSQENIISKHFHSGEQNVDGAIADEDNGCGNLRHRSRDDCERPSLDTTRLPDCREHNTDGATSMTDEDNRYASNGHGSRDGCEMASLGTKCLPVCENGTHLNHQYSGVPSSVPERQTSVEVQETNNEGDSVSVSERQVRVEMPVAVNFTDCLLQKVTHLNPPSSVDQIFDRSSIDVPVLDGVLSSKPCQVACSTSCGDTISPSNPPLEQQIHDGILSIPDGDIPITVPENCHTVAGRHKDIESSANALLVDNSTTNNQEGRVLVTVTSSPVSRQVNVMEPLEQGKQLPSVESAADKSTGEMQNSSEQVQLASSLADVVPANQITMPPKPVHQLAAAEFSSNLDMLASSNFHLATEDEHQPISVHDLPTHHPQVSSAIPDIGQPHPNSVNGLHSNQVAMHPASNPDPDSLTTSTVRAQSANPRNLSTPLEMNSHPIQTTAPSPSRTPPRLSYDPLKVDVERIQKLIEQSSKNHENAKLQLKSEFEKELAELRRKYDLKFQEAEVEFQQTKKTLETNLKTVCVSRILAHAFRSKCLDLKAGASGMQHDSIPQQLLNLSRQQTATHPISGSSGEPPATSLPSPSIAPNSQNMVSPVYNAPGTFFGFSARPPIINTTTTTTPIINTTTTTPIINTTRCPVINITTPIINTTRSSIVRGSQTGGEIRAPAPHLQSSRPQISVPPSSFHPPHRGIQSQTAPSNVPTTSPSHAHVSSWQRTATYQSDQQIGRRPDSAGRLAAPNLPFMGLHGSASSQSTVTPPNVISRLSDLGPNNQSRIEPNSNSIAANSSHQAASRGLVCLSDDDD
ncbi:helicase protein MOM1-like isoform X2 [Vicia villosa]|uniref:helicase protein MOM1-like isoform X2 n=1 Tax=Vicia villosa TaxID=3911 RepID=UPI00273C4CB8|nr:helicase protein MOM1-like isoform X2 [Vicia villosa]